jgi:uncharacterized protein YjbI with pentapeptide repeats
MTTGPSSLTASKPVSFLRKPLKADGRKLFEAIAKGLTKGMATRKWEEIAPHVVDALAAVGLDPNGAGELAWQLIFTALSQAAIKLVYEQTDLAPNWQSHIGDLGVAAEQALEEQPFQLTPELFKCPGDFPVVNAFRTALRDWMAEHTPRDASTKNVTPDAVAARFRSYFLFALNDEWNGNRDYSSLEEAVEGKFARAAWKERQWHRYHAHLQAVVDEPMFDESFGLAQVYQPLRAAFQEPLPCPPGDEPQQCLVVVDLMTEITEWLSGSSDMGMRVVSGGPGSGKSSFARMLAARLAAEGEWHVLFIRLHEFDLKGDLVASLWQWIQKTGWLVDYNPLDRNGERKLFLIFDGLDEIERRGKALFEVAQAFVDEVRLGLPITVDRDVRALITGRQVVIQQREASFRYHAQMLSVMDYLPVPQSEHLRLCAPASREDQRVAWWRAYGIASGQSFDGIPAPVVRPELNELTAQPLLNYLVARTYQRHPELVAELNNLNDLYAQLLRDVYTGGWGEGQARSRGSLTEAEYFDVLEEIAIAAWHGDSRSATVGDITDRCKEAGLFPLLEQFQTGAEDGATSLLVSFFFQRGIHSDQDTYEFTHKSFGEYLTARWLVALAEKLYHWRNPSRRERFPRTMSEEQCLMEWTRACGPMALDASNLGFIQRQVSLRNRNEVRPWQELFSTLASTVVRQGLPVEQLSDLRDPTFRGMERRARNAESALLCALAAFAGVTEESSVIEWGEEPQSAQQWLLLFQASTDAWSAVRSAGLRGLNLSGQDFRHLNLEGANLRGASLNGVRLFRMTLAGADLTGVDLTGAFLTFVSMSGAILNEAILKGLHTMGGVDLSDASLLRTDLSSANLSGADLKRTQLMGANFEMADLTGADLSLARFDEHTIWPEGFDPGPTDGFVIISTS